MRTFQEWLKEAINTNAYDNKVAKLVQKQAQHTLAKGEAPVDGVDARAMIQKAAVQAVTPDTVKPALDSTAIEKKKAAGNANIQ